MLVAAGSGSRFGGAKQYAPLGGRRVLDWALAACRTVADGVVLVVPPNRAEDPEPAADVVVAGGATRSASVRAGLAEVPAHAGVVVVHDAARPLASARLFATVVGAVAGGADGAIPGVAIPDTVKQVRPDRGGGPLVVVDTPERESLVAVQTPQAFRADVLRAAHTGEPEATDDAALVERAGGRVVVLAGEAANRKITAMGDLAACEALLGGPPPEEGPVGRVGLGFDVHPFETFTPETGPPAKSLILAGVVFPGVGLAGHSDGDVVTHAVIDALLGAAGLGDIGLRFPDTDPTWRGADSIEMLRLAVADLRDAGFVPCNVDCSVVLEAPRLAPRRAAMQERLSEVVGAPVTVKAKRAEGLGSLGRREGIACWAVAMVDGPRRP